MISASAAAPGMISASAAAPAMISGPQTLIWHRRDLRLADNALYHNLAGPSLSLFVFDQMHFARLPSCAEPAWDVVSTGPHAAKSLLAAVAALRRNIHSRGGKLIVRYGDPDAIIKELVRELSIEEVRWHEEAGTQEIATAQRVRQTVCHAGCRVHTDVGCTLFKPGDLPLPGEWATLAHPRQKHQRKRRDRTAADLSGGAAAAAADATAGSAMDWSRRLSSMPRVMGDWRRAVRAKASPGAAMLTTPAALHPPASAREIEAGGLPSLADLMQPALAEPGHGRLLFGLPIDVIRTTVAHAEECAAAGFAAGVDGEESAQARLAHFVNGGFAAKADRSLADTAIEDSSKLSVALALGLLSPRQVYQVAAASSDEDTRWLASHMEMRDFFIYSALAAGPALFRREGWLPVASRPTSWRRPADAQEDWQRWAAGRTGLPLVDAALRELSNTGYCSNRVRQNAASLLAKDLQIDWRMGAEWFQWCLADHEVSANYGNWAYFSGVGSDPKLRQFKTVSQAAKYDPTGQYVRMWLPELADVGDMEAVLRPYAYTVERWPEPLVDPASQLTWQDALAVEETGRMVQS